MTPTSPGSHLIRMPMSVLTNVTFYHILHKGITYRKDCLITYAVSSHKLQLVKLTGNLFVFYPIGNTYDNHCPCNRAHYCRFLFVVDVDAAVNKWHLHGI